MRTIPINARQTTIAVVMNRDMFMGRDVGMKPYRMATMWTTWLMGIYIIHTVIIAITMGRLRL
ncbi:hypothetical protein NH00_22205 [Enterobacter cancerogenus]|nr:hypothetical protein NH00_22205 [Enterobacter cancerogenus]